MLGLPLLTRQPVSSISHMQQERAATNRRLRGEGLEGSKGYPVRSLGASAGFMKEDWMLRYMIGREQGIPAISCATGDLQGSRLWPRKPPYRYRSLSLTHCYWCSSHTLSELTLSCRHSLQRSLYHRGAGACDRGFDAAFKFPAATCKPHRVKPSTTTQLQPTQHLKINFPSALPPAHTISSEH